MSETNYSIKYFKNSLRKIIVLAGHGMNGLAYCQEFCNTFALSWSVKMSRKIP